MRTPSSRLTFLVPPALGLSVVPGRHRPCLADCELNVEAHRRQGVHARLQQPEPFAVSVEGPSRDLVFEQTRRFLRVHAKGHGPLTIAAVLITPPTASGRGGRDSYSIVITDHNHIIFAATAIPPDTGHAALALQQTA